MIKQFYSKNYNYLFNTKNGYFARWGKTFEDNPDYSPVGPEIADIEVSSICSNNCVWCYKSNERSGKNMSLKTFKSILDKFPKTLTQCALGIGDIDANPDLWSIMEYCRSKEIIPNITINGKRMTPKYYDLLVGLCGAVAVSCYNYDICYNAIFQLTNRGLNQSNIHSLLAQETFNQCLQVIKDSKIDPRLSKLNAIVFLRLKQKGRGYNMNQVTRNQFKFLVDTALINNVKIGFDSCSAPYFLEAVKNHENYKQFELVTEPCESFGLFSCYINVEGKYFPCSFAEGKNEWKYGLDVLNSKDFIKDIWYHPLLNKYRNLSLKNRRKCLIYNLEGK